jgi:threonine dehydrogenase-like Zn-dependent dehydrogenase
MPDERFLYLSDILPTAWQAVEYADVNGNDTLAVLGLGPVGQLAVRSALHRGVGRVIGVDLVADRLETARAWGAEVVDASDSDVTETLLELTDGRGPDAVIDAVGMEAHGNPMSEKVIGATSRLPKPVARGAVERFGIDRLAALHTAVSAVRRGGTLSISGVYSGAVDPMPMMELFDKGLTIRMGQCHVRRWSDELLDIVRTDDDALGLETFATHHGSLEDAPDLYRIFQEKQDECLKVVLRP